MQGNISTPIKENGIDFKITNALEKKKAFNHITGDSKGMPIREFLPKDNGKFNTKINKGIVEIIRGIRAGNS